MKGASPLEVYHHQRVSVNAQKMRFYAASTVCGSRCSKTFPCWSHTPAAATFTLLDDSSAFNASAQGGHLRGELTFQKELKKQKCDLTHSK